MLMWKFLGGCLVVRKKAGKLECNNSFIFIWNMLLVSRARRQVIYRLVVPFQAHLEECAVLVMHSPSR